MKNESEEFVTSYFGYSSFEEYREKSISALSGALNKKEREEFMEMTKEKHDALILENVDKHCGIVISDYEFCKGFKGKVHRNWRHEHPVVFPMLPIEVQEWIKTKTIPKSPIYG